MFSLDKFRRFLRDLYPFLACYCVFIALILAVPSAAVYRNFYYVFLLVPFLLALNRDDLQQLAGSRVLWIAAIFIVALIISFLWNEPRNPIRFIVAIWQATIGFSFVAMTAWILARNSGGQDEFIRYFAWIVLALAAFSLWHFYSTHPTSARFVAWHWPNPNTGGTIFGLAAVLMLAALPYSTMDLRRNGVQLIALLFALGCVVIAGTRSALLAFSAVALICFALRRSWKPVGWVLFAIVVLIVLAFLFDAIDIIFRAVRSGDGKRLEIWNHYFDLARTRLWTGHGIQNEFRYLYLLLGFYQIDSPHNMFLGAFLYGGLPAGLAYITLVTTMLIFGYAYLRNTGAMVPLAVSLYVTLHGLFETILPLKLADWRWIYFWIPIGIVAAAEIILARTYGPLLLNVRKRKKTATF
jgi:O-antigen ligase